MVTKFTQQKEQIDKKIEKFDQNIPQLSKSINELKQELIMKCPKEDLNDLEKRIQSFANISQIETLNCNIELKADRDVISNLESSLKETDRKFKD